MKYLKRFNESFYEDDINLDITSTVKDILQDLIDDGLNIQCFTIGYIPLKQAGATSTDNDITFSIMSNQDNDVEYKVLDYKKLIPYLQRVIDYVNGEGRIVSELRFQFREKIPHLKIGNKLKQDVHDLDKIELSMIPDKNYESISMYFKLNK